MHKHLRWLTRVWIDDPVYFVTSCTYKRTTNLACEDAASILVKEWRGARARHGWSIGRYVVMPDHLHFFCAPNRDAKPLSDFIGFWKEWTSKGLKKPLRLTNMLWQEQFFDHVLRSAESYNQKWEYVRANPVRAGFVKDPDDWPWQGQIERL
jgi:putative transposase